MANIVIVDGAKYDLDKFADLGISTREEHGISLSGVYLSKTGKVLVHSYSIWDDGHGRCVGDLYHFADEAEIAHLAVEHNSPELVALVPEGED